jgi:hypothetical protein
VSFGIEIRDGKFHSMFGNFDWSKTNELHPLDP